MSGDFRGLVEKILALPADRLAQLEEFVDFLATRTRPAAPAREERPYLGATQRTQMPEPTAEDEIRNETQALRDALRIWQDYGSERS